MEPLAGIVSLLRPRAVSPKIISGAGQWAVRYGEVDSAGFGLVLAGECALRVEGGAPCRMEKGDFVLMPPTAGFVMCSDAQVAPVTLSPDAAAGLVELRHGDREGPAAFQMLGGYFQIEPTNADLLVGLLPSLIHIHAADDAARRLAALIDLIADEAMHRRPGRDLIVERLVEAMLVEALRYRGDAAGADMRRGLLEGLADPNLANALRRMHADAARDWSVAELAREAGLSRSTFSERFARKVGAPPMEYLLQWRMALAKDMLQRRPMPLEQVAAAIGYESASAFSTAFRRRVGRPPSHFARARDAAAPA